MRSTVFLCGAALFCASSFFLLANKGQEAKGASVGLVAGLAKDTGLVKLVRLAEAFKATLSKEQVLVLQLAYAKTDAQKWSNFPQAFTRTKRVGISLGSLSPAQRSLAKSLLVAVLSQRPANEGYDELEGIFAADDYFGETTGKTDVFNSGNYYLAFLGTPSTTGLWELQFGGHHLAVANTYNEGKLAGATPSFRGVEPIGPVAADNRKYEPLENERTSFAGIIESLSEAEKTTARLSATFSDVLLGPGRDGQFPQTKQGIKIGELSAAKQAQLVKAIALYVNDLDENMAKQLMAKYTAGLSQTYFAFSGSGTMNAVTDYARIDGPDLWIEYSAQPSRDFPGTVHPHSVWRDRKTDYGGN